MNLNLNINNVKWAEFNYVDTNLWERIEHGKRLIETDREPGSIPYFSASEYNNGLTDFISNPLFVWENCIIYTTFGDAFWVDEEFTTSDEVYGFFNKNLNKFNALFICTMMKKNQYKFKFGRKAFRNKFENEYMSLPIDEDGNPNWTLMEEYIKSIQTKVSFKPISTSVIYSQTLDYSQWKPFKLSKVFTDIYKGKPYHRVNLIESEDYENSITYVTRSNNNNGTSGFVLLDPDMDIEPKNAIIIGDTTATCYFQNDRFICGDHIVVMRNSNLNIYNGIFLSTVIKTERYKYSYGRAFKMKSIENTTVYLPSVQIKGEYYPDWKAMDDFIKLLPFSDKI